MKQPMRLAVILALAFTGIAKAPAQPGATPGESPAVKAALAKVIQTETPQKMDFTLTVPWIGRAESTVQVTIVAPESGQILTVEAPDVGTVQPGDPLFTLGGPSIDLQKAAFQDKIQSLEARLAAAREALDHNRKLMQQELATWREVHAARMTWLDVKQELDTTTQSLRSLESLAHIRAPVAGVFSVGNASPGQTVDKGASLATIIDTRHLRLVARLLDPGESSLQGKRAIIRADNGTTFTATVSHVLPQRTAADQTVVWIVGDAVNARFHPGQGARGEIVTSVHPVALAIPSRAIVYDEHERPIVFVKEGRQFRKRFIQPGEISGDWVEIRSGLSASDPVVTAGAPRLYYQDFYKTYTIGD